MRKKRVIVILVVVVLAATGTGVYAFWSKGETSPPHSARPR